MGPGPPAASPAVATRRRRRWPWVIPLVLVLAAACGVAWWFLIRTPVHEVPRFVGRNVQVADAAARRLDFRVDRSVTTRVDGTRPGDVTAQRPAAGTRLAEGDTVHLTVSLGPTLAVVPAVAAKPLADAETALTQAGFVVGSVTPAKDETVAKGSVISAAPATGAAAVDPLGQLVKGSTLDLVVSDGPAPRSVPNGLTGTPFADASAKLAAIQLGAVATPAYSDTVPVGAVIAVDPPSGTQVERGTQIAVTVSQGPAPVPIPDVRGQSGTAGAAALTAAGFGVSGIEGDPSQVVLATDPPANEPHPKGTPVRIFTRA